jgi:hypothetical protein
VILMSSGFDDELDEALADGGKPAKKKKKDKKKDKKKEDDGDNALLIPPSELGRLGRTPFTVG